jgi:hypothetical protein
MNHLTEDELVLYRYEESPDRDAVARHLATCADCRGMQAALDRMLAVLDAPVPEPGPAYEREVWMRIQDRLEPGPGAAWSLRAWLTGEAAGPRARWVWPQVALAAGVAVLLLGVTRWAPPVRVPDASPASARTIAGPAGLGAAGTASTALASAAPAGRGTAAMAMGRSVGTSAAASAAMPQVPQDAASIRNRVLVGAVGDHLQRAELMLTEFNNTDGHHGVVDLTEQQAWAEDLVNENRLYRRSAADVNEDQIVALLDDLERALLEVAHAPAETTPERLDRLRLRIGTQDVLFRVRVAGAGMRDRQQMAAVVDSSNARSLSGS